MKLNNSSKFIIKPEKNYCVAYKYLNVANNMEAVRQNRTR